MRSARSFPMRSLLVLLTGALFSTSRATVLDPPSLRCAGVTPGGGATLSWVIPPDPTGEFLQYDIYTSLTPGGPFSLAGSVPAYATNTTVIPGIGTDIGPVYFYITTVSTSGVPNTSVPSDTLATMFVQVDQSTPLGSANVNWNLPHTPPLPTMDSLAIHLEYPIGTFTFLDSLGRGQTFFQLPIDICEDTIAFHLSYSDAMGCTALSTSDGAIFQDVTPPSIPIIEQVSVDTLTNRTVVTWTASPEPDTDGYIIVLADAGGNVILDTIFGQFNNSYVWPGSLGGASSEAYTIAAIDTCWHGTPPHPNTSATFTPHATIFTTTDYDPCAGTVTVRWSPYQGWPVLSYTVYVSVDGNAPVPLISQTAPSFLFVHTIQPFHTYCYVVVADGAEPVQHSLSNKICETTSYANIPQWNYIRTVTVSAPNLITIVDSVDLSARASRYHLERSANGSPWEEVASAPGGIVPVITFNDVFVETDQRSYQYRIQVDDTCGHPVVTSNLGTSLFLTVEPNLNGYNELRWNGYVQWAGVVQGYAIYRSVQDGPYELVGINGPTEWQFNDDARPFLGTNGRFCYYVEAMEAGNASNINAISTSNVRCAIQQEQVWIPNAFIAGGYNDHFRPVLAYADAAEYELIIFNRWGQEIWRTNDPTMAWDGKVEDQYVPQGVYAYYCGFLNGAAKRIERRGTVTFLWAAE